MLAIARRRMLLIVLTSVTVAVLAYVLASLRPVTYSADSVLIVPSGAGGSGPGQANEALRLASTYAELIPRDNDVLLAVSEAVQDPLPLVRENLTVAPVGDTALLRITYSSGDRAEAILGSRTAAESIIAGVTTSDTVPRGSVRLVGLAEDQDVVVTGGVTPATVPIGVFLGAALGVVLATAAERANRRIDSPGQVAQVIDVPVFDLDRSTRAQRAALLRLWRDSAPAAGPAVVAVVGADVPYDDAVWSCEQLADGLPGSEVVVATDGVPSGAADTRPGTVLLVPAGSPGSGQPNEQVATNAHLVVLLLPLSVRRQAVRSLVDDLETYGSRRPGFAVVTAESRPEGRTARRGSLSPARTPASVGG